MYVFYIAAKWDYTIEPIQVGSALEVPSKMCGIGSWDQLQNYLLPISNHWSGYIPEQWKGTKEA